MLKKVIMVALILGVYLSVIACSETQAELTAKSTPVYYINTIAPVKDGFAADFKFKMDGKDRSFAELTKGKVVFLNFWGTWCPPCRKEIPDLVEISKDLKGKDFIMIGVALERARTKEEAAEQVVKYGTDKGIDYINFIGDERIKDAYGKVPAVPTTFIIDKNGKIVEKIVGARDKATFMSSINRVLK